MGNSNLQQSDFLLQTAWQNEEYIAKQIAHVRKYLDSKGVNINALHYKDDENYIKIRDKRIGGFPGGVMSLEEFVDRFMYTNRAFDSIYDMGNPNEIEADLCTNPAVASEIWYAFYSDSDEITEANILDELERKKGLIARIRKYLGIDLNELNRNDDREKCERSKILYFFYMLEHKYYPKTNVLMLLDKPSMENIDNTFLGWETQNGEILRTVKESLGKELSLEEKGRIYSAISNISFAWDNILNNVRLLLDFLHDYGFDYTSVEVLQSPIPIFISNEGSQENTYQYPVERLYLNVSQREYLGNLLDIAFVNKIQSNNNYDVPPELVEEMRFLIHKPVDFNNVEEHIKDNALRLSHYVYLGKKVTREDVRRIRTFAHKFQKFLIFCNRANCVMPIQMISNELQIVSFLQTLILDNQSEVFDYTYHGYQKKSKHMMRVQAALKNDKSVPDALQVYWVRKVTDRWYANVGKYAVRSKLRQIEQVCDEIRKQILNQSTLNGMVAAHDFYLDQIDSGFFEVSNQIQSVIRVLNYLQSIGFSYEDHECKIRYAFLDSDDCEGICDAILVNIQDAIRGRDSSCQIACEAKGTTMRDAGFLLELAFDYVEKTCKLMRFDPVLG